MSLVGVRVMPPTEAGSTSMMSSSVGSQFGRFGAPISRARARWPYPSSTSPSSRSRSATSAALRTAPAVAASFAAGNVRSRSYSPYAAIRQSRHPARTSASAEASRCAGVGAGATTTAGGLAREQADAARATAKMARAHRMV